MKTKLYIILMLIVNACISSKLFNTFLGDNDYASESMNVVFGSSRKALSDYFYDKADRYFHRGITGDHHDHEHGSLAEESEHHHYQNSKIEEESDHHDHKSNKLNEANEHHDSMLAFHTPIESFYTKMTYATVPHGHFHRSGEEAKEILPWIFLAIKSNKQNDELYRTTAYWINQSFGRIDLSKQILKEGQQNIPYSPSIKMDQGMLLLKENKKNEALQKFKAALRFIERQPKREQDSYLKANILLETAVIYEEKGEIKEAISAYEQIYELFPERIHTAEKIQKLKNKMHEESHH